jgi:LTXXQ motif family protein
VGRMGGSVTSILVIVSLALATHAVAQAPQKRAPAAPPPRAAPAPHPVAPVPHPAAPVARPAVPPRVAAPPPRMAPPRAAPHIAAPPRVTPHVAAPPRVAPRVATPPRAAPHVAGSRGGPSRAALPPSLPHVAAPPRDAGVQQPPRHTAAPAQLTTSQQRALQRQETSDRRAQQLQQRLERREPQGRVTPSQRQRLQSLRAQQGQRQQRAQQRQEGADLRASQLQQRLEQRGQAGGRLTRSEQRQLRALQAQQGQRQQRTQLREQMRQGPMQQPQQGVETRQSGHAARQARITPQAAAENRFAGRFRRDRLGQEQWMRARREHWAAREAWQHRTRAPFISWYGPVYWPYAYSDIFDYTFWPNAYDDGYWSYAYDDFFDGIFFPYGAPYVGDAYSGPYAAADVGSPAEGSPGSAQTAPLGKISTAARQICEEPGAGVTAWPIQQIVDALRPTDEQRALLGELKNTAARAADAFRNACPTAAPMTPVGRLQAMIGRLQATLDAIHIVQPSLTKFYDSLSDEQRARFNALAPDLGQQQQRTQQSQMQEPTTDQQKNLCANARPGLADLPIDRINEVVQPTGNQEDALDRLSDATQRAVDALQAACPISTPLTPVGRLGTMEQRVNAMLSAADTIQPALEQFYGALSYEQKARFNVLDRDLAQGG